MTQPACPDAHQHIARRERCHLQRFDHERLVDVVEDGSLEFHGSKGAQEVKEVNVPRFCKRYARRRKARLLKRHAWDLASTSLYFFTSFTLHPAPNAGSGSLAPPFNSSAMRLIASGSAS